MFLSKTHSILNFYTVNSWLIIGRHSWILLLLLHEKRVAKYAHMSYKDTHTKSKEQTKKKKKQKDKEMQKR